MAKKEETLKENLVFDGKVIKLFHDEVLCPNGNKTKREIVKHRGGVAIFLIKDNKVLIEHQYRYAYQEEIIEIPAGKLEKGEVPSEAAKRELEEETGYKPLNIFPLGKIYPTCGYSNEIIHIFLSTDYIETSRHLDDDEFLDYEFISLDEFKKKISSGEIKDAKSIAAYTYYSLLNNK